MSEEYRTDWSLLGGQTTATRSYFHELALREARAASEYHQAEPANPAGESFLTRLRLAFAGRPAMDACNCPA